VWIIVPGNRGRFFNFNKGDRIRVRTSPGTVAVSPVALECGVLLRPGAEGDVVLYGAEIKANRELAFYVTVRFDVAPGKEFRLSLGFFLAVMELSPPATLDPTNVSP